MTDASADPTEDVAPDTAIDTATAEPDFHKNELAGRFELLRDNQLLSYATFIEVGDSVVVSLVFTPPEHRNNGYAGQLMEHVLVSLRADNKTIKPVCPYAATYIKRHPEHGDLVA